MIKTNLMSVKTITVGGVNYLVVPAWIGILGDFTSTMVVMFFSCDKAPRIPSVVLVPFSLSPMLVEEGGEDGDMTRRLVWHNRRGETISTYGIPLTPGVPWYYEKDGNPYVENDCWMQYDKSSEFFTDAGVRPAEVIEPLVWGA